MFGRVVLLLICAMSAPAQAWWSCDWQQRFPADIVAPPGPAQNNYAVRVDLNNALVPAGFDWSQNARDLRVVDQDDLTALDFLVEQWDAVSQTAVVWVAVPVLAGTRRIYFYFDGPAGALPASSLAAMPEAGMLFNTRRSTANPVNRASAEAAFAAANPNVGGYGCASVDAYTNLSNRALFSPPNRTDDIALFAEVFFEVESGAAGVWEFRYGADFGLGGGLYVDDVALEESWNSDLWWANNWNNASEVLQGSINLQEGMHSLRILGFEDCCDGGLTAQFRSPGGGWQDLAVANIPLRSRACSSRPEPVVAIAVGESSNCPALTVSRVSQAFSDPSNGTVNPKAIPGAIILNVTEIQNAGSGTVDAGTLLLTETISADSALRVVDFDGSTSGPVLFVDGSPSSGISYNFGGLGDPNDDLYFSNDGGVSYNYTPSADANGVDAAVTHIRIGSANAFAGNSGLGTTSAQYQFKTRIK